ncbi:MAG: LysM peptidoglycan-binding domain-containing protein [Acidimicrobiia bacterium]|nr:LysM peptidoglycan-binding domain-containing protein [Acidimicrobiia bacterium]
MDIGGEITAEDYPVDGGGRIVALEPDTTEVTVGAGDYLRKIAMDHLGDENRWMEIFDLNKDVVQADGRSLTHPDLIHIGWVLQVPPM